MKNILLLLCLLTSFATKAQLIAPLLSENFNYTDSLSLKSWLPISAWGTNGLYAKATGLVKSGYANSGIGNALDMAASGEDSKRDFLSPITSGNLYASFLISVKTVARAAGTTNTTNYVTGFTSGPSGTNYNLRYYIKSDSANGCYFGIGRGTQAALYAPNSYALNTTYLVTFKYGFNTSAATNDTVAFYVHPANATTLIEPTTYTVNNLGAGVGADATEITSFFLRQGTASDSTTLTIDGIRVSPTWAGSLTLPTSVKTIEKSNMKIYPTLTKGLVYFSFEKAVLTADISVVSVEGKVVLTKKYQNTEGVQTLDLSHLASGTYIVRALSDNKISTQLIEKQ